MCPEKPDKAQRKIVIIMGNQLKLVKKISLQSSPQIMKLSLQKDELGLAKGQRYLWQMAIVCDPNDGSKDLVAQAEIDVVEMPSDLKKVLSTTSDRAKVADFYAKASLWYDALGETLSAEDAKLRKLTLTLLDDLAKLEEPEHSDNLRQVASSTR